MKKLLGSWAESALRRHHLWPPLPRLQEHQRGLRDELRVLLRSFVVPGPGTARRFVVYGVGRSGSTLLVSLLDSNPSIHCSGELLRVRHVSPHAYIGRRARQSKARAWGFKLLDYHVRDIHRRDAGAFLRRLHDDGFAIIHLERQHHLAQALSNVVARVRDVWHHRGDDATEIPPLRVDLAEVEDWLAQLDRRQAAQAEVLAGLPNLHLVYERDLLPAERHLDTVRRVGDFIGVALDRAETRLKKIVPRDLSRIIENYDEVRELAARHGRLAELEP